jgi:hypothetical protein
MSLSIYPALGLGDLLMWKLYLEATGQKLEHLYFNNDILNRYRCNPDSYREFLLYFISNLFQGVHIIQCVQLPIEYPHQPFPTDRLQTLCLYDKFHFTFPKPEIPTKPYIVIHMKARMDVCAQDFNTNDLPVIEKFCKTFQSKYTIMLMGDRNPEPNLENQIHNVRSIYNCFEQCKENNEVIDRTKDNLCSGTDMREFEEDIHLMYGAVCNIVFGYGGPCSLSNVFAKQTICYVKTLSHWGLDLYDKYNHSMIRDLETFLKRINEL